MKPEDVQRIQEIELSVQALESGAAGPFAHLPFTDARFLLIYVNELTEATAREMATLRKGLSEANDSLCWSKTYNVLLWEMADKLADVIKALPKEIKLNELYYPPFHGRRIRFGVPKEITDFNKKNPTAREKALAAYKELKGINNDEKKSDTV